MRSAAELSRRRFLQPIAGAATFPAVFRYAQTRRSESTTTGCNSACPHLLACADETSAAYAACLIWVHFASFWSDHGDFRSNSVNGLSQDRRACLEGAMNGRCQLELSGLKRAKEADIG